MRSLYNGGKTVSTLKEECASYFEADTNPTRSNRIWIILAIIVMHTIQSIRHLHENFLHKYTGKSVGAFYNTCKKARGSFEHFMLVTLRKTIQAIPEIFLNLPIILTVDDTIIKKMGLHFDWESHLFDHSSKLANKYVNGHCMLNLMISIPIGFRIKAGKRELLYLSIPLGYRLWKKAETKLEMAARVIGEVLSELTNFTVLVLCDSWYTKSDLIASVLARENVHMIAAARLDTAMFELPPPRTGKKGRPRKRGDKLSAKSETDFAGVLGIIEDYALATRQVLTKIFGDRIITAVVTITQKGSRRLFLSTLTEEELKALMAPALTVATETVCVDTEDSIRNCQAVPVQSNCWIMALYSMRWCVEVCFFEQKVWWSLCAYQLRREQGIMMLTNLITVTYALMKLLPWTRPEFKHLRGYSAQQVRSQLSDAIRQELFCEDFEGVLRKKINIPWIKKLLDKAFFSLSHTA